MIFAMKFDNFVPLGKKNEMKNKKRKMLAVVVMISESNQKMFIYFLLRKKFMIYNEFASDQI